MHPTSMAAQYAASYPALGTRLSRARIRATWARCTKAVPSWLGVAAVLLVAMALGLLTLLRTPAPNVDEAWNANRAWGMLQTGHAFGTMDSGVFDRYDGYWTYFPWLGTAIHAVAIRAFGPSLTTIRLTSLLFGLVLLVETYVIARRLCGHRVGLVAIALLSCSTPFLYSSHLGRHDIMVATFGFGAIALYLTERSSRYPVQSLIAGLLVGLAFEIHYNGMIYGPVLAALCLFDHGWSVFRARRVWAAAAGVLLGLLYFAAMHVLPFPQTYLALAAMGPAPARVPPFLVADPHVWWESLVDLNTVLVTAAGGRIILMVGALISLWQTRSRSDRRFLALVGALVLTFAAVIRHKLTFYDILLTPITDILAASLVVAVFNQLRRTQWCHSWRSSSRAVAVGVLVLVAMAPDLRPLMAEPMRDYQLMIDRLHPLIPADSTVMGPQTYWSGLPPDQRYLSWEQLVYYRYVHPTSTVEDAFRALRPDFLILDKKVGQFIAEDRAQLPLKVQHLHVPKDELDQVLDSHARLVQTIHTDITGVVRVYRMEWS
ncbi:MAG: ArnT family glycosyltransferase [Chloroflexota bacterium]